jgi:hypothetical protein
VDGLEDRREDALEGTGRDPEDAPASEAATDVGDAMEMMETNETGDAGQQQTGADADEAVADLDAPAAGEAVALDASAPAEVDASEEEAGLDGADQPARLREEAERLQREAEARQQAAAELREEASKLREEIARLLEQPQELQAEAARLREEARAAHGVLEPDPGIDAPADLEEPVEAYDEPILETYDEPIPETEQPTTEIPAEPKRSWLRRRR